MSRYTAGYVLVAGLMVAVFGIAVAAKASQIVASPDKDFLLDLMQYFGVAAAIAGIAMFFLGAARFSKPE